MQLMVVGGGGREHAIIKALLKNKKVQTLFVLPGNAGMEADGAICVPIKATDIEGITDFAVKNKIDFAVVAPDDPLCLGAVDELEAAGIPCFGPTKAAAEIEGSKAYAKTLMKKYSIPTAECEIFNDAQSALAYLDKTAYPTVIKASGLALGKGVTIAQTKAEARAAVNAMMRDKIFGESGGTVVIEEYLTGPEVSVLAFADGKTVVPMVSSMDHKRVFDGDRGPNTGGMGAIAPNPFYTKEIARRCMREIFQPTIRALAAQGRPFKGCLYFGLMLTPSGPKVIEYNCRFGDPETQVVLPLLKADLLDIMLAVSRGDLSGVNIEFSSDSAACIILASDGYPGKYQTGRPISIPADESGICFAGVKRENGVLKTAGGRVLGVVRTAPTPEQALSEAYAAASRIHFEGMHYRKDIGRRALEILRKGK